jgi:hypothetical protein
MMGYGFGNATKTHFEQLINVLHDFRWTFEKGQEYDFYLHPNLLIETAIDQLLYLQRKVEELGGSVG